MSERDARSRPRSLTERRAARITDVLTRRQPDLTVVLEDVHDPHNAAAVLRSCDAVGVLDMHLVYVREQPPTRRFGRTTSASASKWVGVTLHDSIERCYTALREAEFRIVATALTETSEDLYTVDFTAPTALAFGNEQRGLSEEAIRLSDQVIRIPMAGMVESLNISVSCAVSLFEAMRQRRAAGHYDHPRLSPADLARIADDWRHRR